MVQDTDSNEVITSLPEQFVREFEAEVLGRVPQEKIEAGLRQAKLARIMRQAGSEYIPGVGQKIAEIDARLARAAAAFSAWRKSPLAERTAFTQTLFGRNQEKVGVNPSGSFFGVEGKAQPAFDLFSFGTAIFAKTYLSMWGAVETNEFGQVLDFIEAPPSPFLINAGVYVFAPEFTALRETADAAASRRALDTRLAAARDVAARVAAAGSSARPAHTIVTRINEFFPGYINELGNQSPMHRTETVDYGIVLEGELYLVLDNSEVLLKQGDVVIQRGTDHAWANRSDKVARMAFILVDGQFTPELKALVPGIDAHLLNNGPHD